MKLSKRELLKMIGCGSVAAGAAAIAGTLGQPAPENAGEAILPPEVERPVSNISLYYRALDFARFDCIEQPVYDTILIPAGKEVPQYLSFFTASLNQPCPITSQIKHSGLTNMYASGVFNPPRAGFVRSLQVFAGKCHRADLESLALRSWEFRLLDKIMCHGSLRTDVRIGEDPAASYQYPKGKGLCIPPLACFSGLLGGPTFKARSDFALVFKLNGLQWRGIA